MSNGWRQVSIGSISKAIFDGPHATPEKTSSGPYFLGISNLKNGRIDLSDVEHLSEEDFLKWTRRVTPQANDIVFSYETRLGEAALVPEGLRFCLGRRMALIRPDTEKIYPRFLLYAYLAPQFQDTLRARTVHGSTVDRIPLIEFPTFPIIIPPLPEQRAIADVLGALDDKIELNRRMNETLEQMARALFKSWFVDFDPVRRNAERRMKNAECGMQNAEDALFPSAFEGDIPQGWRVGSILDIAKLLSGGTPSTSEPSYWNGDIDWVSAKDVGNVDGLFVLETEKKITEKGVENSSTKFLPAKTTIVTARGTVGAHCMLAHSMTMNQTNYGLKANPGYGDYFVFFTLSNIVEQLKQQSYGTIFDTITTRTFQDTECVQPPMSVVQAFEAKITPLMDLILTNQQQSRTLAALRDALLPRLMSGEIRVKAE